ncbi:AEC family transporter [Paenibacillus humicola]|uniref:AEC family transporter n=1 Tax=Paenibacillus humicola TaxID=3110540 RepID=UPI00237A3F73|nr:AEC family transporter [Paenibacillus humicola]
MSEFLPLFANVSIPILIACLLGALYQHYKQPDSRGLADISLYLLSPCLIVSALTSSTQHDASFLHILLYTAVHSGLCWAAAAAAGLLFRLPSPSRRAVELTTIFGNSNNYGLPLLLLAYGTSGFTFGVTYVVGQILLVNTLGLYLASRSTFKPQTALRQVAKVPLIYAAIIGIALYLLRVPLPGSVESGLKLVGDAYPAVVLLILGMQLRKTSWRKSWRKEIVLAVLLRIAIVPVLAWLVILLLGLHGQEAAVLFVQSSMPAAVNAVVLMEKYNGDKDLVSITVAFTTLASFLYLPLFITLSSQF